MTMPWLLKFGFTVALLLMITACTVTPKPINETEIRERVSKTMSKLVQDQEPVNGPIDLYEAMARALKYNLDTKVEVLKTMLSHQQLDLSHYDMLPPLAVNAGFDGRSNQPGGVSRSLTTNQITLSPSTSSDRNVFSNDLALSWDVLDFGLSYVRAQQAADNVLIAEEEKRRVANRVIQEVRTAYWRAVSAERVLDRLALLDKWVTKALAETKTIGLQNLDSPLSLLQYQRDLISTQREIQQLHQDLSVARIQLASLMNLPPGEDYELVIPVHQASALKLKVSLEDMEFRALFNRPELRTLDYRKRINAKETKAAILEMLPSLNLKFGPTYNSNSFLFHNHWLTYGAKVSWNLLNIFRQPVMLKTIELQHKVLDVQSLAMTMAIMTQVHVGVAHYAYATKELVTAQQYYNTQTDITEQVRLYWMTKRLGERKLIRESMNKLVAELRYETAHADVEAAYANLLAAIGEDPLPPKIKGTTVVELAEALRTHWANLVDQHVVRS